MNQVDIVQKAVLSVDEKYLKERYSGEINIPFGLTYGESLTDRRKKRVHRVCGKGYPGGEIAVVIDHSLFHNFGDGYLFTDKGFYATKGNLTAVGSFKKQGIPPLAYEDIVSVEVVKIYGKNDYICIRTSDSEYTGFASIYAPYFCETIKKILHDLYGKPVCLTQYQIKKQERAAQKAKAAEEKKAKETEPKTEPKTEPTKEIIDMLWEEAMAMQEKQLKPQSSSATQAPKAVPVVDESPEKQSAAPKEAPLPAYVPHIAIVGKEKEILLAAEKSGVKMYPFRMDDFSCHGFIQALCESKRQFDGVVYFTTFEEFAADDGGYVKKMIALGIRRMIIACDYFEDPMDEVTFSDTVWEIGQEIGIPANQLSCVIYEGNAEDIDGMRELYQQVNDKIILPASVSKPFLMPIDEVFSIKEPARVIATGNVMQGSLEKGDTVEIVGFEKRLSSQVTMLEMFRRQIGYVEEGDAPGIALKDVSAKEIERGMVIAAPGSAKMAGEINAVIYALTKDIDERAGAPIPKISRPKCCINGVEITCMVQLPNNTEFLFPGDCCPVKITLIFDIPYVSGMRFTLCGPNYIAEGSIL